MYSMRRRLMALVLGALLFTWLAAALATWFDTRHELDELLDAHLAQSAALLLTQHGSVAAAPAAPVLHRYAPRVIYQVFHEGQLVLRSANAPELALVKVRANAKPGFHTVTLDGASWRVFAVDDAERGMRVLVAEAVSSRTDVLWAVLRNMLWPAMLALPFLLVFLWVGVAVGMAPLKRLQRSFAARQPGDLQTLPVEGFPSELLPMVNELNQLFARIATLIHSERRFTADAAHELRTPIAAIRAQAQVALGAADEGERQPALQSVLQACDRTARIIEQLLVLSRLDADEQTPMAEVDLRDIVQEVLASLVPASLARQQELGLEAPAACPMQGNATLLAVLVRNLVDNAIRYCPAGAQIRVELQAHANGGIHLSVEDNGPGMSDAALQRLGERFYRELGTSASGTGLGWSIVRRIAAVHHWQLQVRRASADGGLRVDLATPGLLRLA